MSEQLVEGTPIATTTAGVVAITERAAAKVRSFLVDQKTPDYGLRLGVKGGGCTGMTYVMDFEAAPKEQDRTYTLHGLKVFVDPKSALYLNGTELDYVDSLKESGFRFTNPNSKKTCSCGESFAV